MTQSLRMVLLGDLHFYQLILPPWRLLGKTLVGQSNLWLRRRHHFKFERLRALMEQAAAFEPDLWLMSGDLTTTGQVGEFRAARAAIEPFVTEDHTVIVPGNHDRYTFTTTRRKTMERVMGKLVPDQFPTERKLTDAWSLVAINSSVPRLRSSRGKVGEAQLAAIERILADKSERDGVVMLCHYPFAIPTERPSMRWQHQLEDAAGLREIVTRTHARVLFLHGHVHRPWLWTPDFSNDRDHDRDEVAAGYNRRITVINAGSPTMVGSDFPNGQGYWEIELHDDETGAAEPVARHRSASPSYAARIYGR